MPTWARAIIFGFELIGFLIFCIVMVYKFYKRDRPNSGKIIVKVNRNENIISFSILYAVILLIFFFGYPTLTFLSFDKMLMVGLFIVMFTVIIISEYHLNTKNENFFSLLFTGTGTVFLIIFSLMITEVIYIGY